MAPISADDNIFENKNISNISLTPYDGKIFERRIFSIFLQILNKIYNKR